MIVAAAIRKDGNIYTDKRHYIILRNATPFGYLKDGEQGFLTDDGKFVDRIEGLKIAKENNQIIYKHGNPNMLFSEDIIEL